MATSRRWCCRDSCGVRLSSTPYPGSGYTHSGWPTGDNLFLFVQDELDETNLGTNTLLRTLDISDVRAPFISNIWQGPTQAIDHNVEVLLCCDEGYCSSLAAARLHDLGLHRATDVIGGFQAWRAAGLPVEPAVSVEE